MEEFTKDGEAHPYRNRQAQRAFQEHEIIEQRNLPALHHQHQQLTSSSL